jgi:hypothetical protein
MNKNKFIIFIAIITITIAVIAIDKLPNFFIKTNLEMKELVIGEGDHIVNKDFASGCYDVEVIEGELTFSGKEVTEGDKLIGQEFYNANHIILIGSGKVKIVPAKYEKITLVDNCYKIENSGNYIVGKQLEAGTYKLSFIKENGKNPFVQILSDKKEIINSYTFEEEDSYEIILKDSNILEINKGLFEEYKNYYILLQLQ